MNNGESAFPWLENATDQKWRYGSTGMTLHDYFMGQALAGLCANSKAMEYSIETIAEWAARLSVALLAEREKNSEGK